MECRLLQVVQVSDQPGGGSLVLGDVLRFHVREDFIENFRIDPDKLRAVGRMAGSTYVAHYRSFRARTTVTIREEKCTRIIG